MFQRLIVLALIIAIALPLAACGRKGSPVRSDDSEYPRSYPHPNPSP
ncbi:MAG: lipoprotein [Rhodospirillales bacterium]|nr:lipoprotein [Rhodospirillales bacterium]